MTSDSFSVLLVEDDRPLARSIARGLEEDGFVVAVVGTVANAMAVALAQRPDTYVVDLGLPDGSGVDLIVRLRTAGLGDPILVLTARGDSESTVSALEAGADAYVVKPESIDVLGARLRALRRRAIRPQGRTLRVGDLFVDPGKLVAERDGHVIDLTPTELRLLEALMDNPGMVLSREQLVERISIGGTPPASNVIDVHIRNLRAKIDEPFGKASIETVRGLGYRFARGQR